MLVTGRAGIQTQDGLIPKSGLPITVLYGITACDPIFALNTYTHTICLERSLEK